MATTNELGSQMLRTLFEVLAEFPEGLHKGEVWNRVLGRNPALEERWSQAGGGKSGAFTRFTWDSTGIVKAGWLRKDGNGRWQLTGAGRHTLEQLSDKGELGVLVHSRYQHWDQNKDGYELACNSLQTLPEGWWVSLDDLADQTGLDRAALMHYLSAVRPEGWHRVLDEQGGPPACAHFTEAEYAESQELLDADGILGSAGWTLSSHRLSRQDLTEQMTSATAPASQGLGARTRAWLLRGTDEEGNSLVRSLWLRHSVCSLFAAASVGALRAGMGVQAVRDIVNLSHDHWTAEERDRLAYSLHTFVSRVQPGDIVLTNVGQEVHLGRISSAELRSDDAEVPDQLLRPVEWHTASAPLDLTRDLPQELAARVGTPNTDLLDLTGFVKDLEQLFPGAPKTPSVPVVPVLPQLTEEFARSVFMDRAWLTECVDLLRDKPQLVFYGPPGTGKTYLAQELAGISPVTVRRTCSSSSSTRPILMRTSSRGTAPIPETPNDRRVSASPPALCVHSPAPRAGTLRSRSS